MKTRGLSSEAMIKLTVGDKTFHTAAEVMEPVNALDNSLRESLDGSISGNRGNGFKRL